MAFFYLIISVLNWGSFVSLISVRVLYLALAIIGSWRMKGNVFFWVFCFSRSLFKVENELMNYLVYASNSFD